MGAFLEKPKTEKFNEAGMGNGIRYGLASMQGWRMEMEDAHSAVTGLPGHLSAWSYFAVFDGHAGHSVSTRCAEELLGAIVDTDDFKRLQPETAPSLEEIQKGIREGFLNLDQKMRHSLESNCEDKSGSTAVCVLTSPSHFFFVNCGDSRSILIRDNVVVFSTTDHKPSNPDEKARITKAGGSVMIQRVNGSLAVSRSLGDYEYKNVKGVGPTEQLVSPEPEISIVDRDEKSDQIVVLACDGVWDVMSNDDVANFVLQRMKVTENLVDIANEVIDTCFFKVSFKLSILHFLYIHCNSIISRASGDSASNRVICNPVCTILAACVRSLRQIINLMDIFCRLQRQTRQICFSSLRKKRMRLN